MKKKNKKEVKTTDGVRRSLYFSQEDIELLNYADSRPINRNQYILNLIREDMDRDPNALNFKTVEVSMIDLKKVMTELEEIKGLIKSGKFVIASDEVKKEDKSNILKPTDQIITGVDWDDVDGFGFSEEE